MGATPTSTEAQSSDALGQIAMWETSVLFCGFVLITLVWEFLTALLAFITVRQTGRKAIWITRLKNEVLALGVITLVLSATQSKIESICISGPSHSTRRLLGSSSTAEVCAPGYHQMFPYEMIHSVHYLLFFIAITHIIVTFISFYLSLYRMKAWKAWERQARHGRAIDFGEVKTLRRLGGNRFQFALNCLGLSFLPQSVSQTEYNLLRVLFRARVDNALEFKGEEPLPRNFNFLLMTQNVMEIDFAAAGDHSFAILLIMALYLLVPRSQRGIYYLSLLAIVHLIIVNAKLHAAVIQLCGTTIKEFQPEMDKAKISHFHAAQKHAHPAQVQMTAVAEKGQNKNKIMPEPAPSHHQQLEIKIDPPIDTSRLETRVVVHLLPSNQHQASSPSSPSPPSPTRRKEEEGSLIRLHTNSSCKGLFWLGSRGFLNFLFQLGLMELSLALVLLSFGLIVDSDKFINAENAAAVIACIVVDVFVLGYASLKVQPLAALVSSVGTLHPAKLVSEIKKMKIVSEEDYEDGLGGKLVMACFGAGEGDSDDEEEGGKTTKEGAKRKGKHGPHMSFVLLLADQAGIVGQGATNHSTGSSIPAIHTALMDLWIQKANQFKSVKQAAALNGEDRLQSFDENESRKGQEETMGVLKCKLSAIHEAFEEIDQSGDGLISHVEIAGILRELGTRMTREEVEDMISEINGVEDPDADGAIDFTEFCLFLVFKFLDYDNDGFVDKVDLIRSLENLKKSVGEDRVADALLEYCLDCMEEEEMVRASSLSVIKSHRISLACFIRRFRGVELIDEATGVPPKSIEKRSAKRTGNSIKKRIADAVTEFPGRIISTISSHDAVAGAASNKKQ